jgi:hypothetical protein
MQLAAIFAEIERQLSWRGPSGKGQGHIVLDREQAEALLAQVLCPHGFRPRKCPVCGMIDRIRKAEGVSDESAVAQEAGRQASAD